MRKRMGWVLFVAGAVLSWGIYGSMLADGQMQLGSPLKALLCVGAAYFLVGVIVPVAALSPQGGCFNRSRGLSCGLRSHVEPIHDPGRAGYSCYSEFTSARRDRQGPVA